MLKSWLRQDAPGDIADIFIDATIPDNAENILNVVVPQIDKKANIAAQLEDVILESIFHIQRFKMLFQLSSGFLGEST